MFYPVRSMILNFVSNHDCKILISLELQLTLLSYCCRLCKRERKQFFNGLNPSFVTDNKLIWKTVKPFFSDKGNYGANIKLVDGEELLQNEFFKNAVSTLGITKISFVITEEYNNISDPVQRVIVTFESHPSISPIKNKITMEIILNLNQCH